jgi:hypothetical protein
VHQAASSSHQGATYPQLTRPQCCLCQHCLHPTGLTPEPDAEGYFTYTRPEGKSGGHGVGWSEVPRYTFKVPEGWQETPVSIADLGGTEVRSLQQ